MLRSCLRLPRVRVCAAQRTLGFVFCIMSLVALPVLTTAGNGSRIGIQDVDAFSLSKLSVGNIGVYIPPECKYALRTSGWLLRCEWSRRRRRVDPSSPLVSCLRARFSGIQGNVTGNDTALGDALFANDTDMSSTCERLFSAESIVLGSFTVRASTASVMVSVSNGINVCTFAIFLLLLRKRIRRLGTQRRRGCGCSRASLNVTSLSVSVSVSLPSLVYCGRRGVIKGHGEGPRPL